jgi:hypothetical protein
VTWLAVLAAAPLPDPSPVVTPGTTTPVQDALHWAMADFLITLGAALASLVQIIAVLRTLSSVGRGRKQQAELLAMQHRAYERQAAIMAHLGIAGDKLDGDSR